MEFAVRNAHGFLSLTNNQSQSRHCRNHGDLRNQHWLRVMAPYHHPAIHPAHEMEFGKLGCLG